MNLTSTYNFSDNCSVVWVKNMVLLHTCTTIFLSFNSILSGKARIGNPAPPPILTRRWICFFFLMFLMLKLSRSLVWFWCAPCLYRGFIRCPKVVQFFESTSEDRHTCSLAQPEVCTSLRIKCSIGSHITDGWSKTYISLWALWLRWRVFLQGQIEILLSQHRFVWREEATNRHPFWKACVRSWEKVLCYFFNGQIHLIVFCFREPPEDWRKNQGSAPNREILKGFTATCKLRRASR